MKLRIIFVSLLFTGISYTVNAQNQLFTPPSALSPQSANLIKAIEYPVDYAHGLPDISIPLYTVTVNDIKIPIILKYHAGGIKVLEESGWVGLGWSLNAEPSVSRTVNGLPDEASFLGSTVIGDNSKDHLDQVANGQTDELPDQFYYSLPTKQGSFFFNRTPGVTGYTIKTLPFDPILISNWTLPSTPAMLAGFNITDDEGRQYSFGYHNMIEQTDLQQISTWKGNTIVSSNFRDTVYFDYNAPIPEYIINGDSQSITIEDQSSIPYGSTQIGPQLDCTGNTVNPPDEQLPKPYVTKVINGTLQRYLYNSSTQQLQTYFDGTNPSPNLSVLPLTMQTLYLKTIRFRGGKVTFTIATRTPPSGAQISENHNCLSELTVYDANNNVIKHYKFNYTEIQSLGTHPQNQASVYESRLRLTSLQDITDAAPLTYSFTYNATQLPNHFTYDMDLWGYYNGPKNNKSLIPATTIPIVPTNIPNFNLTLGDADRTSDASYMQADVLTNITYPTGGSTLFSYEANQAIDPVTNTLTPVGGLRIVYIDDFVAPNTTPKIRYFKYGVNENGAGYVRHWLSGGFYSPYLIQQNKNAWVSLLMESSCGGGYNGMGFLPPGPISSRIRTITSTPVTDIFYNGYTVAYPQVTEYQGSPNNSNYQGKTIYAYQFSQMGSFLYATPYFINGTTLPYDSKIDWVYGTLQSSITSKNDGNNTNVQSSTNNYVPLLQSDKIWSRSVFRTTLSKGFPTLTLQQQNETFQTQENDYQSGYNQLLTTSENNFQPDGSNPVVTTHNYSYGNPSVTYPTQISLVNSDQTTRLTKNYFAQDMVAQGQTEPYQQMITNNYISPIIMQESYLNGVLQSRKTNVYARNWPLNSLLIAPQSVKIKNNTATEETRVVMNSYDEKGNILSAALDGATTSYQWGYNGLYLVAKCKNAASSEFYFNNFEDAPSSGIVGHTGNNCSTSSVVIWAKPAGRNYVISYWYKTNNSWKYSGELPYTAVAPNNTYQMTTADAYDDIRIFPNDALMSTYTYSPLVGMTSSTDPKGLTTYYEYDNAKRLINIKDKDGNVVKHISYNYQGLAQ